MSCPYKESKENATDLPESKTVYYNEYLQLDKLLTAQSRESEAQGAPAHDEHLFIVIHQAYELWFKQILFELESCITLLSASPVDESALMTVVHRFTRVTKIQSLLVQQMAVLETMTPLDFLDFRKFLSPASGFQSVQFRMLENRLGLPKTQRQKYNQQSYEEALTAEHADVVRESENKQTLFDCVESWLERCPFVLGTRMRSSVDYVRSPRLDQYDFWSLYTDSVHRMLEDESTSPDERESLTEMFETILDSTKYNELHERGKVKLSHQAFKAALMIMLYRDEPLFQMPFTLLQRVMDIDNLLTQWRHSHAAVVQRMLGAKMGTGGSSGYYYLRTAAVNHRIFRDFFNMATYMIPRTFLPELPPEVRSNLQFKFSSQTESFVVRRGSDILLEAHVSGGLDLHNHANADIIKAFAGDIGW